MLCTLIEMHSHILRKISGDSTRRGRGDILSDYANEKIDNEKIAPYSMTGIAFPTLFS